MYGQSIQLNAKGQTTIKSYCGAIASIIIYTLALAFSTYKLYIMVTYNDDSIQQDTVEDYFTTNDTFNFDDNGFKIAFTVVDTHYQPFNYSDYV